MKKYGLLGLVVVLVAVVLGLISRQLEWEEYTVPMELRGEAARNEYYAAERFARSLGARAEWRQTLGELPPPPAVLVLQYWEWNLIAARRIAIERWVEAGGRLVIYGPLRDDDEELFVDWAGLSREDYPPAEESVEDMYRQQPRVAADDDGCRSLTVLDDVDGVSQGHSSYQVCMKGYNDDYLASDRAPQWSLQDRDGMQAVRVTLGRGSVTWLNIGQVFGSRHLMKAEHGLLFVAVTQLRPGDQFIFLSEVGHPSLLSLIWKYGAAIVVVAALALLTVLWRRSVRFGPLAPVPELARRSLVEQIRGTGRFVRRFGNGAALHGAARRALYEAAQRRIPLWSSLPEEQRVLALAGAVGVPAGEIREALQDDSRSKHELKRTLERLEQMRRRLILERIDAN